MSPLQILSKMRLFKEVPKKDLIKIINQCESISYAMGAVICHQGDSAEYALILIEGKLDVSVRSEHTTRSVGSIHPGEIFGEQGLFHSNGQRNATVLAVRPSICLKLTPKIIKTQSSNLAMVALERHLIATMARRIRATNMQIQKAWKEESDIEAKKTVQTEEPQKSLLGRLRSLFGGK